MAEGSGRGNAAAEALFEGLDWRRVVAQRVLAYMLKRQDGFRLFLDDGRVDVDSSLVENAIRSPRNAARRSKRRSQLRLGAAEPVDQTFPLIREATRACHAQSGLYPAAMK